MSKRLRNYTPPDQLMERYGADALRLYLINSGLVRGEEQRFADSGVKDMVRRALLPWYNAFQFLKTYAAIDGWSPEKGQHQGSNILDQWILSKLQSLKQKIAREMNQYHLYNVVPELFHYIEDLTNWYIRLNRARFWGEDISADKIAAYSTLYVAVSDLSIAMAPFAPFLSEYIFQQLATLSDRPAVPESVHLCPYPEPEEILVKPRLEDAVSRMQQVILLGRRKREEMKISLRTPLSRLTIIHSDQTLLDEISTLEDTIRSELNVKSVHYDQDEEHYIKLYAKPNFPLLGRRLGKRMKEFQALIQNLDRHGIDRLQQQGMVEIGGEQFSSEEIEVFREAREGTATMSNRFISIELDCQLSEELICEGRAREMVNRIQRSRKDLGLNVADRIHIRLRADQALLKVLQVHQDYIMAETLCTRLDHGPLENGNLTLGSEDMRAQVAGLQMSYSLKVQP